MKKLADFLVDRRAILLGIMLVCTVICGILIFTVPINKDRSKYLSDSSNMKQGLAILNSEFPEVEEKSSIRVMFTGLTEAEKTDVRARLEAIPNVSSVTYEADSSKYNKADQILFVVNSRYDYKTDEELEIENRIKQDFAAYDMKYRNNDIQSTEVPIWLLLTALAMAIFVLLVMTDCWLDPVLLLTNIAVAIVLNMGTNFSLPFIDEMTFSVGPVIQMVLSMDYSIILMNRYRQEKLLCKTPVDAMKAALKGSISSVASSSLTTAVGLLALLFLSFKLGPELGFVLAKGVFFSMICTFTILPVLILKMDAVLERTKKRSPQFKMGLFAKFSYRTRYLMPLIFIALFIGFYSLQNSAVITFTETSDDPLEDIFPKENVVAMIYRNEDAAGVDRLIADMEQDPMVTKIYGYTNTLGKQMDASEMAAAMESMGGEMELDADLITLLYRMAEQAEPSPMTAKAFIDFLVEEVLQNERFADYLGEDIGDYTDELIRLSDSEQLNRKLTSAEMAAFFGFSEEDISALYLLYSIEKGIPDSGKLTLAELVDFVLNTVAKDETYGEIFDGDRLAELKQLQRFTDRETVTTPVTAGELAALFGMETSAVEIVFVLYKGRDVEGKTMTIPEFTEYLTGTLMEDPAFSGYFDGDTAEQVRTMEKLVQTAVGGKQLSASKMAKLLGMDRTSVEQLYYLYYRNDSSLKSEAASMRMSLSDFLELANRYAGEEEKEQLASVTALLNTEQTEESLTAETLSRLTGIPSERINSRIQYFRGLVTDAILGVELDAAGIAMLSGQEESDIEQLFALSLAVDRTVSLADFSDFLATEVLTNPDYAGSFSDTQAAQLRQMNEIVQAAAAGKGMESGELARLFGMDAELLEMLFRVYFGGDTEGMELSPKAFAAFVLNEPMMADSMDREQRSSLKQLRKIMDAVVKETAFDSKEMAEFLGMEEAQAEQLYILYSSEHGGAAAWRLSPAEWIDFAVTDVLENEVYADRIGDDDADGLRMADRLVKAVLSESQYGPTEMAALLSDLSGEVTEENMALLYDYYGAVQDGSDHRMTIPEFFAYLKDAVMTDERFAGYFDEDVRRQIAEGEETLRDSTLQMKGETYSRLVLYSDYPEESEETLAYIGKLNALRGADLSGDSYLIGNSVMVSEMNETFEKEYLEITLITAIAIFLVVLAAFRNPTLPLILTLLVQCGVFITVTVIGAYSGAIYYLALLIVQSILMGATIDYGIVFCNYYLEHRREEDMPTALRHAYEGSIHTIMTSGAILVLVLTALGLFVASNMISEVSTTLAIGAFVAILLILLVLPALTACCDRLIIREKRKKHEKRGV